MYRTRSALQQLTNTSNHILLLVIVITVLPPLLHSPGQAALQPVAATARLRTNDWQSQTKSGLESTLPGFHWKDGALD